MATNEKSYLCKYRVSSFIFMLGDEKIVFNPSNILMIEYMCDYDFNLRAVLKVSLRIDVRQKLWILKNKREIICKFELCKIGSNLDVEGYNTSVSSIWNEEFGIFFNDDEETTDLDDLEERLKLNEGTDANINDINDENYFESQNLLDVFLFNQKLLDASRRTYNAVMTSGTLQQYVAQILTETKHSKVLMSKFENDEVYTELLTPANPAYKCLAYLDQYYGFYKFGAQIFYDVDTLYILNPNGKVTAKRPDEWPETTVRVMGLSASSPGNGMIERSGEKMYYVSISDMNINPQKFSISRNADVGSAAKVVISDSVEMESTDADQSFISQRNEAIVFAEESDNKYMLDIVRARMEENEVNLYVNADNLDISAFTPNKVFYIVFDETSKQKKYGSYKYRVSYAYHAIRLESTEHMSSSHRFVLKRCAELD